MSGVHVHCCQRRHQQMADMDDGHDPNTRQQRRSTINTLHQYPLAETQVSSASVTLRPHLNGDLNDTPPSLPSSTDSQPLGPTQVASQKSTHGRRHACTLTTTKGDECPSPASPTQAGRRRQLRYDAQDNDSTVTTQDDNKKVYPRMATCVRPYHYKGRRVPITSVTNPVTTQNNNNVTTTHDHIDATTMHDD
ncbi:uncharacterized protein LACBIDRAFT_334429 [Laccaria bicolor S238N-H82]|uniref:Predicted protein n=1 Tax=Laccaria bicolor (strain S238N-H82 / ATCC MYA-4686) TaxID=486041 RepID=B0DZ68_LACBS|nr:uncharacterized protein LACBIDRAFT_334429 [Laccaria bicolor S238N-H82]EDR00137.1 predicted protein [Laccaria bicolor S238N-H82]|eukprot:XP_001889194.1 predicted protein [Laccaria bicolor S238N-H82]